MKTWIIFRHFRFRYHRYHSWNIQETESRTLLPGTRTWAQCPSTTSTLDLNVIHCCDFSHGKRTDAPRRNRTCLHRSWQSHHKDLATKKNHGWIGWTSIERKTQFCIGFHFPNKRCVYLSILLYMLLLLKFSCNRWMRTSTTRHGNIREPVLNLPCKPQGCASGRWNPATWLFWWDSHHFI